MHTTASEDRLAATRPWSAILGTTEVVFGPGARAELPDVLARLKLERPLLVTDPGVRGAGHVDPLAHAIDAAGGSARIFDDVRENPTTEIVAAGVAEANDHRPDAIVAIGGGSTMDAAKGINFIFTNGGRMEDYEGMGHTHSPLLPAVGIPTTAGTGSEAQSYALIATAAEHRKMACGSRDARFRAAILDPELLVTVPRMVRFVTGIDAVAHAVESYVSTRANPVSRMFSENGWARLNRSFLPSLEPEADLSTRGDMMIGAHMAGAAIEASMLGAAHACANPLTANYGIVHGLAVGLMLPHVVRYNSSVAGEDYARLGGEDLPRRLQELLAAGGTPLRLREHGVPEAAIPELARGAATQWTGQFNPRAVEEEDLRGIYESAY
jgi:alcohol dehydrogenase